MGLFSNPLGYAGYGPGATGTIYNTAANVRAATATEAAAGTLTDCYISPATADSATALDFANPPAGGFGSGTRRPVFASTLSSLGATTLNVTGAATTTIGTGGTGIVQIGNTTGNTAVTGSLTASTTLTASSGAITATNGNLVLGTAGNKLSIATGSNASIGTSVAMTAGSVTISTTAVTASSKIFLTANTAGGTPGELNAPTASIVAGTSFVINSSSGTDTSTVNWLIIN